MHYSSLILIFCLMLTGCGKPPLLNKLKTNSQEIAGNILLSEQFPKEQIEFSLNWTVAPSLDNLSAFEIELKSPLKNAQTLNAFIWMPDMGHGSSPIEMRATSLTNYSFTEVAFIMPGTWVLHIEVIENNLVVDEWQKSLVL